MKFWKTNLAFGILVVLLLGTYKADLLYHMEQYSLFSFEREYLLDSIEQPGGLLAYAGAFLTQFCHFPILGAILIALGLCLLAYLVKMAFKLSEDNALLAFLPSVFLLFFITSLDYSVYLLKTYGLLFSQMLGFIASAALLLLYRKVFKGKRYESAFAALSIICGYPIIGVYALLPALLAVLFSFKDKGRPWILLACTIILGVALPILCSSLPCVYPRINRGFVFLAGLPYKEFIENFRCQIPLILAALSMVAVCFMDKASLKLSIASSAIVLAAVLGASNWDPNFHRTLKMERAISDLDWDKVLVQASKSTDPTRAQVLYRNIALYQKGQLTEEMFKYPDGNAKLHTHASIPLSYICAAPVLYHCGMLNSCDRLVMEASSSFSKNIFYYKYQAKTALLSGEKELAKKYISMVDGNLFQNAWVKRYTAFLNESASIGDDAEFKAISPLIGYSNDNFDIVASLEQMLFNHFSKPDYINEQVYEWQMAMHLTQKHAEQALFCAFNRDSLYPGAGITTGISEGIALFASAMGDVDLMKDVISLLSNKQAMLKRFSQFSKAFNSAKEPESAETRERFKKSYDGSYWFYYYFVEDISAQ